MFCHKCGRENPNDSRFCRYCGSTIMRPKLNAITDGVMETPPESEIILDSTCIAEEAISVQEPSQPEENVPVSYQESLPVEGLLTEEPLPEETPIEEPSAAAAAQGVDEPASGESGIAVVPSSLYEDAPEEDAASGTQEESETSEQTVEQDPSAPKRYPTEFAALCTVLLCDWIDKKLTFFTENVEIPKDTVCASCGSTAMEPVQKNITKIKTGGYNVESACCGTCLLGPFGLLCGLIGNGSKTNITNETWWICKGCGKQHISHATALEKVELATNGLWGNALLGGAICSCILYWGISSVLLRILAVLLGSIGIPLIVAGSQYDAISEELGYSVVDIMDAEKRTSYAYALLGAIGLFAAAMLLAVPLLEWLA